MMAGSLGGEACGVDCLSATLAGGNVTTNDLERPPCG